MKKEKKEVKKVSKELPLTMNERMANAAKKDKISKAQKEARKHGLPDYRL